MAAMDTAAESLLDSATGPAPRAISGLLPEQDEYIQEDRPLPLAPERRELVGCSKTRRELMGCPETLRSSISRWELMRCPKILRSFREEGG